MAVRAERRGLHEERQWLGLLHYRRGTFTGAQSRVRSGPFFLADEGRSDPKAELRATLAALLTDAPGGRSAQCRFPARKRWLAERLDIADSDFPVVECDDLEDWLSGIDAGGLTLVFAEAFMNDPSSMFGHTLLRVDPTGEGEGRALLGHSIDYAASTGSDLLPVYLFKGIAGFYPGRFRVRPFYEGLRRYADWENRDIWEYRLDVNGPALELLLLHLWELRDAELPYYFFTENCSSELLGLVEVAVPEANLRDRFAAWVIPVDTVRALESESMFSGETAYRPSPETELRAGLGRLDADDRALVDAIVAGEIDPAGDRMQALPIDRAAQVLELSYDQLRYQYLSGATTEDESRQISYRILLARSRLGVAGERTSETGEVPEVSPEQGHRSARLKVAAGWRDDEAYLDLGVRPALHALLDDARGYRDDMELRVLDATVRIFPESGDVRLQELTVVGATSLSPRSRIFRPWAWSFETGLATRRVADRSDLDDASVWSTELALGLAYDPIPGLLLYGLADARLDVGPDLEDDVSFGPGARAGAYWAIGGRGRLQILGEVTRFAVGDDTTRLRGGSRFRFSATRNTAVVAEGYANRIHGETWIEGALRVNLHF